MITEAGHAPTAGRPFQAQVFLDCPSFLIRVRMQTCLLYLCKDIEIQIRTNSEESTYVNSTSCIRRIKKLPWATDLTIVKILCTLLFLLTLDSFVANLEAKLRILEQVRWSLLARLK